MSNALIKKRSINNDCTIRSTNTASKEFLHTDRNNDTKPRNEEKRR